MANLKAAIRELPYVAVFDNDDLTTPFQTIAVTQEGGLDWPVEPIPDWMHGFSTVNRE